MIVFVSNAGSFKVMLHQEPFNTRVGNFRWEGVNDGCAVFRGWL